MASQDYDFVFKILLIGNSAVGKSSLLLRFADEVFHESFLPTIGVDFKIRTIEQAGSVVKLQMWDTAGQEKFKTVTHSYYKGAQGIILVFDLCDQKSFGDIRSWVSEAERHTNRDSVKVLVGNKCDLDESRQVKREQAQKYAQNEGMIYFQASAKINLNVDTIFMRLSAEMKERYSQPYIEKYKKTSTYLMPTKAAGADNKVNTCC